MNACPALCVLPDGHEGEHAFAVTDLGLQVSDNTDRITELERRVEQLHTELHNAMGAVEHIRIRTARQPGEEPILVTPGPLLSADEMYDNIGSYADDVRPEDRLNRVVVKGIGMSQAQFDAAVDSVAEIFGIPREEMPGYHGTHARPGSYGGATPPLLPPGELEIGGQRMTQAQFDAARFPLTPEGRELSQSPLDPTEGS